MVDLHLIDESCENCSKLFFALEETMSTNGPIAVVITSSGSIILYMEERFLIETNSQIIETKNEQTPSAHSGKDLKRRRLSTERRIRDPSSSFSIVYKGIKD